MKRSLIAPVSTVVVLIVLALLVRGVVNADEMANVTFRQSSTADGTHASEMGRRRHWGWTKQFERNRTCACLLGKSGFVGQFSHFPDGRVDPPVVIWDLLNQPVGRSQMTVRNYATPLRMRDVSRIVQ